jgi:5-oxoprolinase (ATP-hydrolysing) subunit A
VAIDVNADVGEGFADDRELIPLVSSVNIACGAHAGDEATIRRTIELALRAGAAIGAHPSYPDRDGFGRRDLEMELDELAATVTAQVEAILRSAGAAGAEVRHVKPHGALYNRAARDSAIAATVAHAVAGVSKTLAVVGLAGSESLAAAEAAGLLAIPEAFADRRYEADGRLRDRREADAVIADPDEVGVQAVRIAADGTVLAVDGSAVRIEARSLCVHGDQPGAVGRARAARAALEAAGIDVRPVER